MGGRSGQGVNRGSRTQQQLQKQEIQKLTKPKV